MTECLTHKMDKEIFRLLKEKGFKPDLCCDMLYFDIKMLPKDWRNPDVLWCSPTCETFSMSGDSMYMGFPTKPKTYIGLALAYKCIELIQKLKPKYWIIENPRAGLRNVWFMKPLQRTTVTYCQYGHKNMKPTDIWNNFGFKGKICNNGDSCHESAPRGSNKGTSGEKSTELRGIIPQQLCEEILILCEKLKNEPITNQ